MEQSGLNRQQRRALQQAQNDAQAVLAHAPSLRFICRILTDCGYFDTPYAGNSNATFMNVGKQETGRQMVRALQSADPDALLRLLETASRNRADTAPQKDDDRDEV